MAVTEDTTDQAIKEMASGQLSFKVGLPGNKPDFGSCKIGGDFSVAEDLKRRQEVVVTISLPDGTVLAHGPRKVTGIHFKDTEDQYGNVTTERIHTLG